MFSRISDAPINESIAHGRLPSESSMHAGRPVMSTRSIAYSNDSQHSGRTADEKPVNTVLLLGHLAMQNALPVKHGIAGLQSDNDVRVHVTSKHRERRLGI
jgi:hypothetical protein